MTEKRKNLLNVFRLGVSFGVILLFSGCVSHEDPDFAAVSSQLEYGGSYYRISGNSELFRVCGDLFRTFERALTESGASAEKDQTLAAVSMLELAVRCSGISECRWSGASSVRVPDVLEPTFRNRSFFLLPENPRGVLWRLPGTENRPLLQELADLPSDTLCAGDFNLDLRPLGEMLEQSTLAKEWLDANCRILFKASPRQVLEWLSGEWGFAFFPASGRELHDFVLTFPDREKHFFTSLVRFFRALPGVTAEDSKLFLPLEGKGIVLRWYYDRGRITVYSGESAEKRFLSSDKGLARQPDFKRLSFNMPVDGAGIFYSAGTQPETESVAIPVPGGKAVIDKSLLDRPFLAVLRREKNGVMLVSQGGFDLQSADILNFVVVPALMLAENFDILKELLPGKDTETGASAKENVRKKAAAEKEQLAACAGNLKKLAELLKQYASRNGGMYPAEMDVAGIKKILPPGKDVLKLLICPGTRDAAVASAELLDFNSCSYFYFGAWKKNASGKLPLLVDRPGNHFEKFHVVFNDGSCEQFTLENCESFKRMAGFLHTRFQYQEDEFRELIKRASRLDNLLDAR